MIIMSKKNVGKVLAGAAVGVGLGMLFAPKKGSDLRKDLKNKIDEFISKIKDVDANEVKDEFFKKADEIKKAAPQACICKICGVAAGKNGHATGRQDRSERWNA